MKILLVTVNNITKIGILPNPSSHVFLLISVMHSSIVIINFILFSLFLGLLLVQLIDFCHHAVL